MPSVGQSGRAPEWSGPSRVNSNNRDKELTAADIGANFDTNSYVVPNGLRSLRPAVGGEVGTTPACCAHFCYSYSVIKRRCIYSQPLDTNTSGVVGEYPYPPIFQGDNDEPYTLYQNFSQSRLVTPVHSIIGIILLSGRTHAPSSQNIIAELLPCALLFTIERNGACLPPPVLHQPVQQGH